MIPSSLSSPAPASGFAGRIAGLFIDSKLTPLVIVTSIFLGAAAIFLLPRFMLHHSTCWDR
jgi:hypothetical protein